MRIQLTRDIVDPKEPGIPFALAGEFATITHRTCRGFYVQSEEWLNTFLVSNAEFKYCVEPIVEKRKVKQEAIQLTEDDEVTFDYDGAFGALRDDG